MTITYENAPENYSVNGQEGLAIVVCVTTVVGEMFGRLHYLALVSAGEGQPRAGEHDKLHNDMGNVIVWKGVKPDITMEEIRGLVAVYLAEK